MSQVPPSRTDVPFVKAVPEILRQRQLSRRAVARQANIDPGHFSRVLRHAAYKAPSAALVAKVAHALDLPDDYFPEYREAAVIERIRSDSAWRDDLYDRLKPVMAPSPGIHFPEPEALEVPARRRAPEGYFYVPTPVRMRRQPLHETYLRLYDLDLGDNEAIDDFVRTYGRLGMARYSFSSAQHDREPIGFELNYLGFPNGPGALSSELRAENSRLTRESKPDDWAGGFPWALESLPEFRHGATLIKDMVSAWRWINEEIQPAAGEWEAMVWKQRIQRPPRNKGEAAQFLQDYLDEGLAFFPPGLALRGGLRTAWSIRPAKQEEGLPLYPICCLQLANHIFEGAKYRTCQKTDCSRHFVRQQGRAKQGQNWTKGVQFCRDRCANTQGARDRRGSSGARPKRSRGRRS
jgi:transcriptional regulator with XRE-family HTH domain